MTLERASYEYDKNLCIIESLNLVLAIKRFL